MSDHVKMLLAQMAVKSPGLEFSIAGTKHGSNRLDVAGAAGMAGCNGVGWYLCLAKYARDPIARLRAIHLLTHCILLRGEKQLIEQNDAESLAELIIDLEIEPGLDRCPKCKGRKTVQIEALTQDCKKCEGVGRVELSERRLAAMCDIDRHTFRNRDYKELITHYQAKVGEWETSTLYRIAAKNKDVA